MMASSLRLQTYNISVTLENEAVQHETLFVNFEEDYADIFPTPIHLQQFLQKFFDLLWQSFTASNNEQEHKITKMHNFSLIGGDDESLDVQFTVLISTSNGRIVDENTMTIKEEIKTAQAFLPDDDEIMAMHKEYHAALGGKKRMNDGGEYVDDDDEEDYY
jgi:hypothetical protein